MEQKIKNQISQLIEVFEEALDITLPSSSTLHSSPESYLLILQKILPQYSEFYNQLRNQTQAPLQDKIEAIITFIEEELLHKKIQISAGLITQNNKGEILELLKVLFDITNRLFCEDEDQEGSIDDEESERKLQTQQNEQRVGNQKNRIISNNGESEQSYPMAPLFEQQPSKGNQSSKQKIKKKERELETQKIVRQIVEKSQKIKEKLKPLKVVSPKSSKKASNLTKFNSHKVLSPKREVRKGTVKVGKTRNIQEQGAKLRQKMMAAKLQYLANINSKILDLEKQKLINEKKHFIEDKAAESRSVSSKLEHLDNMYNTHIKAIMRKNKEKVQAKQRDERQKEIALKSLRKEVQLQNKREAERLERQWNQERARMREMMREEYRGISSAQNTY